MQKLEKVFNWLTSLRIAIFLMIIIAISCALGTSIPQGEPSESYINIYNKSPLIGFISGELLLFLQLDKVYTSYWFIFLLSWLGFALTTCSWRRQWPMLKSALTWIDYKQPRQIAKLAIAQSAQTSSPKDAINNLSLHLKSTGWRIKESAGRISARKGLVGRVGPLLVHLGIILLMIGATYGALTGQKIEEFLVPGRSIEIINPDRKKQLTITLEKFQIKRDPKGRAEQFISNLKLNDSQNIQTTEKISVNHPLRYRGITIYQADWSLSAITLTLNDLRVQLPLKAIPELGEQVWGTSIQINKDKDKDKDKDNLILLTLSSEEGPISIYNLNGKELEKLRPGIESKSINNTYIKILKVITSSGILIKYDPGVPIVYLSFLIILIGGSLSIISTKQIWALTEEDKSLIHIGGLSNRNLSGLSKQIPELISKAIDS